jgi:hypothetical protein
VKAAAVEGFQIGFSGGFSTFFGFYRRFLVKKEEDKSRRKAGTSGCTRVLWCIVVIYSLWVMDLGTATGKSCGSKARLSRIGLSQFSFARNMDHVPSHQIPGAASAMALFLKAEFVINQYRVTGEILGLVLACNDLIRYWKPWFGAVLRTSQA